MPRTTTSPSGDGHTATDQRPGARAWQSVLTTIEGRLLTGELAPGDHLPPERTLAAELAVGRSSVREALRVLEALGLIRTATGSGPSAGAIIVAAPRGGMSALLRLQVAAQGFPVHDIVHTRLLLETGIVEELARTTPRPALASCRSLLTAMSDQALPSGDFLALDTRFHVALAEATHNTVVTAMMAGLRESIESYVFAGSAALPDWGRTAARLRCEHQAVIDAIEQGESAKARTRIRDHITGYYAEISAPSAAAATDEGPRPPAPAR
ncbi:MAG TPA: FCD domain-containing protein [Microbacteriaceae bacterium]|nr:FCD domain-containing protein [Microbacteriaceae bacterium]